MKIAESYTELIETCSRYKKILVSGPQRSGTTFTAKEIARVLKYKYVDEEEVGWHDYDEISYKLSIEDDVVLQAPGAVYMLDKLLENKDILLVFMRRDLYSIIKSQERIKWEDEENQKNLFKSIDYITDYSQPISYIKYKFFEQNIQERFKNVICMDYDKMDQSPKWINERQNFSHRQTG
jgi:hypothetical protein